PRLPDPLIERSFRYEAAPIARRQADSVCVFFGKHSRLRFLVAFAPMWDLLLRAKYLFVAATLCSGVSCTRTLPPRWYLLGQRCQAATLAGRETLKMVEGLGCR